MDKLTVVSVDGSLLVGEMDLGKLRKPRMFSVSINPRNPKESIITLKGLPGSPEFITLKDYGFYYPVKDVDLISLYLRAMAEEKSKDESKIVLPH